MLSVIDSVLLLLYSLLHRKLCDAHMYRCYQKQINDTILIMTIIFY